MVIRRILVCPRRSPDVYKRQTQQLREKELYDLKAIPALYLLDRDKRVLVKDGTDSGQIEWVIDHR